MHGVENVNRETFLSLPHNSRPRVHPMKIIAGRFRADKGKYFFAQCIVKLWNSLPQDVARAINLDGFKRGLDKFLEKVINGSLS